MPATLLHLFELICGLIPGFAFAARVRPPRKDNRP